MKVIKLLKDKRILLYIFLFCLSFLLIFGLAKSSYIFSSFKKIFLGENQEVSLDHWEISTVFYDSTVDGGNTPLTEINWDASDGGYSRGETREITLQINYKNTNSITRYGLGELEISIPNLIYKVDSGDISAETSAGIEWSVIVGANDSTHTGYDWNLKNYASSGYEYLVFSNNVVIDENSNFEGSIQIVYTITPTWEYGTYGSSGRGFRDYEFYEDECTHSLNKSLQASINNSVFSNTILFNYSRIYSHPWERMQYQFKKVAENVLSIDNMGSDSDNYIWVKYSFAAGEKDVNYSSNYIWGSSVSANDYYPKIVAVDGEVHDVFPNECLVYNTKWEQLEPIDDEGTYVLNRNNASSGSNTVYIGSDYINRSIYVGYPKSIYNIENNNMQIVNRAELYARYGDRTDKEYIDEASISINLNDYEINYDGALYDIEKNSELYPSKMRYQDIINNGSYNRSNFNINPKIRYSGELVDAVIGDDLIYSSDFNGNISKVDDDDYYFSNVRIFTLKNANGDYIQNGKYDCEIWIRFSGESEYTLYEAFKNGQGGNSGDYWLKDYWSFSASDKVVGWYIKIKNLNESIWDGSQFMTSVNLIKTDIPHTGKIYNYSYMNSYIDNIIQNTPSLDYYDNDEIANYDMQTYGRYMQRDSASNDWIYYNVKNPIASIQAFKSSGSVIQDEQNQLFIGNYSIGVGFYLNQYEDLYHDDYFVENNEKYLIHGLHFYDLLPDGMELISTKDEIINSLNFFITSSNYHCIIFDKDGNEISSSVLLNYIKEHCQVVLKSNWKDTGRTKVEININLSDFPIYLMKTDSWSDIHCRLYATIKYSLSYDSFLEYGGVFQNYSYADYMGDTVGTRNYTITDSIDINENGDVSDRIPYASATTTINSVISTHQDVQVSVQTDKSNYSTDNVETSNNTEYNYKLRVRTGTNDVTNLVIYDSIEKYAKDSNQEFIEASGGRNSWAGDFLGIDTSYAESKGYTVKVYYSEKEQPGSLSEDDGWNLYTDSVDKSKIKSLAFEYLDSEGNSAVIPANSLTYVLIKMKSPTEELKTFAYNGCWTEWNALDSVTGEVVDFITGINSNIVRVGLPSSVEIVTQDITVEKNWLDNNDSLGLRPDTILIKLIPNGDISQAIGVSLGVSNVDSNDNNHWYTTVNVPKYDDNGDEIFYTIEESGIDLDDYSYVSDIDGYSITNTLNKKMNIKKKWIDNHNSYLTRPSSVTVKLLQNNEEYKDVVISGNYSDDIWNKEIIIPMYDSLNREYNYTLREVTVDDYISSYDEENNMFINKLTGEKEVQITKEWVDNSNEYNTRPDNLLVNLLRNDELYEQFSLSGSGNNWTSEKLNVPVYDDNGIKYNYTIEEENVNGYGEVEYNQNNFHITNKLKEITTLTVIKNWIDNNNEYGTRPNEIKIMVLRNGDEYQELTLSGSNNSWSTTLDVEKYDDNQIKYEYTIREENEDIILEYGDVSYDDLTVTNRLDKKTNLTIKKKWLDEDNKYLTRPKDVEIILYRNKEVYQSILLSGNDNIWENVVDDLPVYDESGKKYQYTIKEKEKDSKYGEIIYDQTEFMITNKLTDIPKVTLYFTVKNGYVRNGSSEILFDEEGYSNVLNQYNLNSEDEYVYYFKLKNEDTGKTYEGKLTTQGILQFEDIPYGTYRAVVDNDKYFDFVSMLSIEDVDGVEFRQDENGGVIIISPTGKNIIYGANIINKIDMPLVNPNTHSSLIIVIIVSLLIISLYIYIYIYYYKKLEFLDNLKIVIRKLKSSFKKWY